MDHHLTEEQRAIRELARTIAEDKVKPATCEKAAGVLRSVSASLSRLAEQIESKAAPKKPS